jgi:hypothetical protein
VSGTWEGNVNVPSTANGTFEVSGVMTGQYFPGSGDMTDPTPAPSPPTLAVNGVHIPRITARVIPDPVPFGQGFTIRWSVIDSQTAKPYGTRLRVWLRMLPGVPAPNGWLSLFVNRPGIVSATPSKTSAPVGSIVPVNGSVAGAPHNCPVNLQRLYGATQWRTVSTANVRQSGRYTVNAQPAYKGSIPYRVSFPACYNFTAGLSKTFSIRGT